MLNTVPQRPILFITRSWHGTGGMQRFSHDFYDTMTSEFGERFTSCYPYKPGMVSLLSFSIRALVRVVHMGRKKGQVHLGDASLLLIGRIAQCAGARLSITVHGLDVVYPPRWYQRMITWLLPKADRIVSVSAATADAIQARGVPAQRCATIPNGIRSVHLRTDPRDPQLLISLGRLVPRKGVAWFIESVFPLLLRQHPDLHYIVVGSGPEEERIQAIIHRLHLEKQIDVRTDCSDAACIDLMQHAAVCVMPNVHVPGTMEGFGIVCIEAAACGLPVAAARIEGVQDAVIDGQTGRFFKAEDAEDCARVVHEMLLQPLAAADIAAAAHRHFNWNHIVGLYRTHVFQ